MPDNNDPIQQAMTQPKKGTVDGQSFEQQPIRDLIAADKYLSTKEGVKRRDSGLRFSKFQAPGGV